MRVLRRHGLTLVTLSVFPLVALLIFIFHVIQPASGVAEGLQFSGTAGSVAVKLEVAPAVFGSNRFLVTLKDAQGQSVQQTNVQLTATMLDMAMATQQLRALPVGKGRYQVVGSLPMPGHWRITTTLQAQGSATTGAQASFTLNIGETPRAVPTSLPLLAGAVAPIATPAPVSPGSVRWKGLPYQAAVSFLSSGAVYLPGKTNLLRDGTLNHSITAVPGHQEAWATDYAGNQVAVIDMRSDTVVATIPVGLGPVHVAFSADGKRAWVSDFLSNDVEVIDVVSRKVLATIEVGLHPHGLAISPDGQQVWVACSGAGAIYVLDTHTNKVTAMLPAGIQPHAVAFSPDGRTVYMTDAGATTLVILNRASGNVLARVSVGTGSAMDAVSRDGSKVYVTGQSGSVVTVIDTHTHRVITRIPVGSGPHGLALTPNGQLLYVAVNNASRVAVINTQTNRLVASVSVPGQADELVLVPQP